LDSRLRFIARFSAVALLNQGFGEHGDGTECEVGIFDRTLARINFVFILNRSEPSVSAHYLAISSPTKADRENQVNEVIPLDECLDQDHVRTEHCGGIEELWSVSLSSWMSSYSSSSSSSSSNSSTTTNRLTQYALNYVIIRLCIVLCSTVGGSLKILFHILHLGLEKFFSIACTTRSQTLRAPAHSRGQLRRMVHVCLQGDL
jgi:hypothetical protein